MVKKQPYIFDKDFNYIGIQGHWTQKITNRIYRWARGLNRAAHKHDRRYETDLKNDKGLFWALNKLFIDINLARDGIIYSTFEVLKRPWRVIPELLGGILGIICSVGVLLYTFNYLQHEALVKRNKDNDKFIKNIIKNM